MTNAERLARGVPPAPPLRRGSEFYCAPILFYHVYHSSIAPTRRAAPSASVVQGNIQVTDSQTGIVLGYISKEGYQHTWYQYSSRIRDALHVRFTLPDGATSGSNINLQDRVS